MRLLIGVDEDKRYEPALRLLKRLDFDTQEWHVAHVRPNPDPNLAPMILDMEDAKSLMEEDGMETLQNAGKATGGKVHLLKGASAPQLLRFAEDLQADIVGLGSSGHSVLGATLLGSVGRAFAIGSPCSFMVGRGQVEGSGPVRVVFATDHSDYARRALSDFLAMKPRGVSEIRVMTAYEMLETSEMVHYLELVEVAAREGRTLREHLTVLGEEAAASIRQAGIEASSVLQPGSVGDAIDATMKESNADLVVLGAQGHGFLERLLIGSVALNQVVAGRYSTLVLRRRRG